MSQVPFGYKIVNGYPEIDTQKAEQIRNLYQYYPEGLSLEESGKKAGIIVAHTGIKKMLSNRIYLGEKGYPRIISNDVFERIPEERTKRAKALGRMKEVKKTVIPPSKKFRLKEVQEKYKDPFRQAEYAYSLIEEVNNG